MKTLNIILALTFVLASARPCYAQIFGLGPSARQAEEDALAQEAEAEEKAKVLEQEEAQAKKEEAKKKEDAEAQEERDRLKAEMEALRRAALKEVLAEEDMALGGQIVGQIGDKVEADEFMKESRQFMDDSDVFMKESQSLMDEAGVMMKNHELMDEAAKDMNDAAKGETKKKSSRIKTLERERKRGLTK